MMAGLLEEATDAIFLYFVDDEANEKYKNHVIQPIDQPPQVLTRVRRTAHSMDGEHGSHSSQEMVQESTESGDRIG